MSWLLDLLKGYDIEITNYINITGNRRALSIRKTTSKSSPKNIYPKRPVHEMGNFTHFVYGIKWVKM